MSMSKARIDDPEVSTILDTVVACVVWMIQHDAEELALQLRDEFLSEWYLNSRHWNHVLDQLMHYIELHGRTPEVTLAYYRKARFDGEDHP
jgi:hypothetical protein